MIGIIAQGRMGNQLFQYAFVYSNAKELDTSFFIDGYSSLHYFELYDGLQKENKKNKLKYLISNFFVSPNFRQKETSIRNMPAWLKEVFLHKKKVDWDIDFVETNDILPVINNNAIYKGFFQSETYFKKYAKDIRQLFAIKKDYKDAFAKKFETLYTKKTIALHIRRGDYVNFGAPELGGFDLTLPLSYYKKCLHLISNKEEYNIIFVSDDIEYVKTAFGEGENYFFESNSEIIDFQLLLNADIQIVSNSSFSWWAAWLNEKTNKITYAPDYYLGFKVNTFFPTNIRVDDWNWVNVK
ncbi:MAG TPA: alpha-1,2-fucosyltransferase [Ferruginibacter sp.]|nr:alpha-1,2-fucosyltransferase [Ferruginibacter sp.]